MKIEFKRGRKLLMVRTPPVSRHPAYEAVERLFAGFNYTAVTKETLSVLLGQANDIVESIYKEWNKGRSRTKKMAVPKVQARFPLYTDERGLYGQVCDTDGHVYASLLKIGYAVATEADDDDSNHKQIN